ncbi:MAG: FAD-dependent oxidoreductase [Acidobacteria bacterium]|nr:FAD-dependent oxidoreductase [Acidobacteriota bacterium]
MVLILGGGLAGLSAGRALAGAGRPYRILEREDRVGGLCRTVRRDGFAFDLTGHLLHLRTDRCRRILEPALRDRFLAVERRSYVYSHGVFTEYPFQANTHGLPPRVIRDCLLGFLAVHGRAPRPDEPLSFRSWILRTFGTGIAEHFMIPFNEKIWCADLDALSAEWVAWSIPQPSLEEVVGGAVGLTNRRLGYNAEFFYPRAGGIDHLPNFLAEGLRGIELGARVESVDLDRRRVRLADGTEREYDTLVSTMPLDRFLRIASGLPGEILAVGRRLRSVRVVNLNLGVERAGIFPGHWIYFPEPEFPFYRVGFPANFTPRAVPPGCASMYVEFSLPPGAAYRREDLLESARAGLRRAGILRPDDRIPVVEWAEIDPAYVLHDPFRREHLPQVVRFLAERDVICAGRFGAWGYGSMEDAIREGMEAAERILAPAAAEAGARCAARR